MQPQWIFGEGWVTTTEKTFMFNLEYILTTSDVTDYRCVCGPAVVLLPSWTRRWLKSRSPVGTAAVGSPVWFAKVEFIRGLDSDGMWFLWADDISGNYPCLPQVFFISISWRWNCGNVPLKQLSDPGIELICVLSEDTLAGSRWLCVKQWLLLQTQTTIKWRY